MSMTIVLPPTVTMPNDTPWTMRNKMNNVNVPATR